MRIIYLLLLFFTCCVSVFSQFVHPGLLHTTSSLERIQQLVKTQTQPAYGSYLLLTNTPGAKADYKMQGPFEIISRDGEHRRTKGPSERDFNAAYYNALQWIVTGKQAHADKAMEIIRAYAKTLKQIPATNDAPLCAALQGFILVNAAEIMRYTYTDKSYSKGWSKKDTKAVEAMFRNVFQPVLTTFYQRKPYTNGNWGAAATKAQEAFGIFLNDKKLYEEAIEFFYHGDDNGSLPNYIAASGQLQESGRDQQHSMLGISCLAEAAEVAWTQGQDLYSALDNRILKGYEYVSKSNLGYEVPFVTWTDKTGKYSKWTVLSQQGLGRFRAVFEIAYNHYVERKGLEMPYTQIVLERIRPEGEAFTCDNAGFGSLLFYLGKENRSFTPGELWKDDKGVHINAHGGGILSYDNRYYWFGEHKIEGGAGNSAQVGVHVYSSVDLYNWKDEGIALSVSQDPENDIAKGCILERPKVIYNQKTGKFVMWFHLEPKSKGYTGAMIGIAQADEVTGPYRYIRMTRGNPQTWPVNVLDLHKKPLPEALKQERNNLGEHEHPDSVNTLGRDFEKGQHSRDMTLFVDDDGKAYQIRSAESNSVIHISELTDDYLDFSGKYVRAFAGRKMEAPAVFKKDGLYYFMGSGCTGWKPNPARSAVAPSIWGPWTELGNPCPDEGAETTYLSQSTYILPVQGKKNAFIYLGDRWTPSNAIDGRYIWLPIDFEGNKFKIHWQDKWDLTHFSKLKTKS